MAACDVFLAVIGPNWLDAKDDSGRRRFDNPDDFVTIEIAAALARNIRVIPVLVDGARTPKADKLPDSVKPLVRRNAVEVRNAHFGRDAEALANKVREALQGARPGTGRWPFLASAAAWLVVPGRWRLVAGSATALLLVGWVGLYQVGVPVWVPWTPGTDPPRADKAKAAADAEAQRKAEEERQRLKEEEQRQAQAAADAEAKRKAAEAEQQRAKEEEQRQAKAAADAEAKRKAAEAEQQRLAAIKEEEQRQAKAADVEAKLKAAEAEQQRLKEEVQRQAKAAADAEAKRKAAEAEQQRLKEEAQRQAQAAADAEAKRKAAEAEQQRLAAVRAEEERKAKAALTDSFERRSNIMATGWPTSPFRDNGGSMGECERKCSQSAACKVVSYNKIDGTCNFYSSADFVPNDDFDSGIRADASEQQRLAAVRAEEERNAKSEAEAAARRKAEEAEQQRAAALRPEQARSDAEKACDARAVDVNAKPLIGMARISFIRKCVAEETARSALLPQSATTAAKAPFEIRINYEAVSPYAHSVKNTRSAYWSSWESAMSTGECETICARSPACNIFSYRKSFQLCYMYSNATLAPNSDFDSGIRK